MSIRNLFILILLGTLLAFLLFAACQEGNYSDSDDDDDDVSDPGIGQNPELSDCGGFGADTTKADDDDDLEECGDERLQWDYDEAMQVVTFMHKDVFLNCCGEHSIAVYFDEEEDVYEISETDDPEMLDGQAARCDCMCLFDFGVELGNVEELSINVKITIDVTDDEDSRAVRWEDAIDLSEAQGEVLIEENVGWCY